MTTTPQVDHVYAPRGKEGDTSMWERVDKIDGESITSWSLGGFGAWRCRDDWNAIDWVEITPAPVPPVDAIAVPCDVYYHDDGVVEVVGISSAPNCPAADCFVTLHIPPKKPAALHAVVVTGDGK